VRLRSETPERDKIQIRSGQHQLDTDEDENRVTPAKRRQESMENAPETKTKACNVVSSQSGRKRPTSNVQRQRPPCRLN
jgi:hypothetical protein